MRQASPPRLWVKPQPGVTHGHPPCLPACQVARPLTYGPPPLSCRSLGALCRLTPLRPTKPTVSRRRGTSPSPLPLVAQRALLRSVAHHSLPGFTLTVAPLSLQCVPVSSVATFSARMTPIARCFMITPTLRVPGGSLLLICLQDRPSPTITQSVQGRPSHSPSRPLCTIA